MKYFIVHNKSGVFLKNKNKNKKKKFPGPDVCRSMGGKDSTQV